MNILDELVCLRGSAELAYASADWEHPESGEQLLRAIERANKAIEAERQTRSVSTASKRHRFTTESGLRCADCGALSGTTGACVALVMKRPSEVIPTSPFRERHLRCSMLSGSRVYNHDADCAHKYEEWDPDCGRTGKSGSCYECGVVRPDHLSHCSLGAGHRPNEAPFSARLERFERAKRAWKEITGEDVSHLLSPPEWPPMPAWADDGVDDKPLPEDAQIDAVHPATCDDPRHDLYAEAMRLVGARRSKGGLVMLVHWLLLRAELAAKVASVTTACPRSDNAIPGRVYGETCWYCKCSPTPTNVNWNVHRNTTEKCDRCKAYRPSGNRVDYAKSAVGERAMVLIWIQRSIEWYEEPGRFTDDERRVATGALRSLLREVQQAEHVPAPCSNAPTAAGCACGGEGWCTACTTRSGLTR